MATVAAFSDVNELDSPADDWSSFAGTENLPVRKIPDGVEPTLKRRPPTPSRDSFALADEETPPAGGLSEILVQTTLVTILSEPCEWLEKAFKSLATMRYLEDGWNSYGAPAPGDKALANATLLVDILLERSCSLSRIAPSVIGGVGMTLRRLNRKAYFEFDNDGRSHMLLSDEKSDPEVSEVEATETCLSFAVTRARKFLNAESS